MISGNVDSAFIGFGTFSEFEKICQLSNQISYKGSSKWRLPKWEELKQIHPFDWQGEPGEMWTDNATSSSFTAKKMDLSTGEFKECNQRVHYEEAALLRLLCDEEFEDVQPTVLEVDRLQFLILPFGEMTYPKVDELNELLASIGFLGFSVYRRPTIEELELLSASTSGLPDAWFWSSSEGGKYNAFKMNVTTGEKYACKKSADYSEGIAFSVAVVSVIQKA